MVPKGLGNRWNYPSAAMVLQLIILNRIISYVFLQKNNKLIAEKKIPIAGKVSIDLFAMLIL